MGECGVIGVWVLVVLVVGVGVLWVIDIDDGIIAGAAHIDDGIIAGAAHIEEVEEGVTVVVCLCVCFVWG